MTRVKKSSSRGLFDHEKKIEQISEFKTPLDKLNEVIDFEMFREELNRALKRENMGIGGASHYDYVLLFKIIVFQKYYNISDEKTEFMMKDSFSVMRFLGINYWDNVPDQKKIWEFKEKLNKTGAMEKLFKKFDKMLIKRGIVGRSGKIVDASFVEVPKQRNRNDENDMIKNGEIPSEWKENPHKLAQKDTDARWALKYKTRRFGYKNNIKADSDTKLIRKFEVTPANVHDSRTMESLIDDEDRGSVIYGDKAYSGRKIKGILDKKGIKSRICDKGYRNRPLDNEQNERNHNNNKVRCRVEHVFGFMRKGMGGKDIRTIGIDRARFQVALLNLVYNLARYCQIACNLGK